MSLATELANLAAVVTTESTEFEQALKAKAQSAVTADQAGTLSNRTSGQVSTDLDVPLVTHVANKQAHSISAAQLGTLSGQDVDALFAKRPVKGTIPVSRYGTLNYLPAGVSGSFEGATTGITPRNTALFLEDDGTLTYLRNGLNGSKMGVYYAYLLDALGPVLNQPVKTNRQYSPSYFPVNASAAYVLSSSETAIFGRMQDANGNLTNWFLSITNGSYDDSLHTGCFISDADVQALGISRGEALVVGSDVVLLSTKYTDGGVFEIWVHKLTKAAVAAGGTLTPVRVTGFSTTGFGNVVYNTDSVRLCNKTVSNVAGDNAAVYNPENTPFTLYHFELPSIRSAVDSSGNIRSKFIGMTYAPSSVDAIYANPTITVSYSLNTRVGVLDAVYRGSVSQISRVTPGNPASNTSFVGPIWATNDQVEARPGTANCYMQTLYSGKWLFNFRVHQVVDTLDFARTEMTASSPGQYQSLLRGTLTAKNFLRLDIAPAYGSAIGGVLSGPYPLSDTRCALSTRGKADAGNYSTGLAYSDLPGAPTFNFKSLNNGAMQGYAPSPNRKFLRNLGITDESVFCAPLCEVNSAGVVVSGRHFVEGLKALSGPNTINPDFTTSGTFTISDAVFQAAKAAAHGAISLGAPVKNSKAQLWVPKSLLAGQAFMSIQYVTTTGEHGAFMAQFNVTVSNNVVTGLSLLTVSPKAVWITTTGLDLLAVAENLNGCGGVVMYDNGSSILFGVPLLYGFLVVGNAPNASIRFRINKSTGAWSWGNNLNMQVQNIIVGGYMYYASPSLGFCMSFSNHAQCDYGTKMPLALITKNSDSEFDNWAMPAATAWKVLVSQDVAATWQLYFTEPTPLMVNGNFYTMAQATFDLTAVKANPANTKFYVFAVVTGGVASYVIQLTFDGESSNKIYLGYIQTGVTAIETVAIEKVTKINYFRVSQVSRGSAVAATPGNPANTAALQWS